jgi:hypothetical protein
VARYARRGTGIDHLGSAAAKAKRKQSPHAIDARARARLAERPEIKNTGRAIE